MSGVRPPPLPPTQSRPLGRVPSRGVLIPLGDLPLTLALLPPVIWTGIFRHTVCIIPLIVVLLLHAIHVIRSLLHLTNIHTHLAHLTSHHLHPIPDSCGVPRVWVVVS